MRYFLGIDTSTTATKALLLGGDGSIVAEASAGYSYETPQLLWSEQNPALWWEAACKSIRRVLALSNIDPAAIKGIGLTGQMHGLVLLNRKGKVLRPAILWNDQRTGQQCDTIRERLGRERLIQITGNDALTGFTAPKILWVQENEPEIFEQIYQILLPKDYVRYKLSGTYATDKAGAAGTLLFDLKARNWSSEMLDALDLDLAWMPPTYEGTERTGRVSEEAAAETGLLAGTPLFGGGGDQAASAVGTGAVSDGIVSVSLGTSGVVFASVQHAAIEPEGRLHAFCHAVPGQWHFMGVMLSAAGSLRWYRDTFAPDAEFDDLLFPAKAIPAGSEGLLFLPYLTGERTPHPDPHARGAFVGLTVRHTLAHTTRAILEGVAFGLRDSFALMKEAGLSKLEQVRITGGGARSPLWRQILADVLDCELVTLPTVEGAAYGAAILAGVGGGAWFDVPSACKQLVIPEETIAPQADNAARYEQLYPTYRALYPALRDTFEALR